MNATELNNQLKKVPTMLNDYGFNFNHPFSRFVDMQIKESQKTIAHLVKKVEKDFRLNFEFNINPKYEEGSITVFLNVEDLKNKFYSEYQTSDEGGFTFGKVTGFAAKKAAEILNKYLNTRFSSSSFSTSGNWVGFHITTFGKYGNAASIRLGKAPKV